MKRIETIENFAVMIYDMLKSDRDNIIGVGGFTGEGKTRFSDILLRAYSKVSGSYYDFDRMTWSRKEMMMWIDGKGKSRNDEGLKEGQLPEYSCILADELFAMFYRRNWFNQEQIDAIATFNMCRDRHLLLAGNIPNFWELDTGFTNRVRFYVYIPWRGTAWVFEQENNPFSEDRWNKSENKKRFRKKKNPYSLSNFVCEIHFDDWTPKEKERYYAIRNDKRVKAIEQNTSQKKERYSAIKGQRDELIRMLLNHDKNITHKDISDVIGISQSAVSLIFNMRR